ncbi:hemagglutinin repeat-containing protein [Marinimicrobium sp. LS-A18]|uniref:hemagglutinin repeat-containing protein n=1 Tax=Marinimicrobium sp. LS-A18 TaxID=1381596 RepID=UPI000466F9F5|nr:hemagglutinin repeat-containing protein [Marinimicrobium sp. LS-A18]
MGRSGIKRLSFWATVLFSLTLETSTAQAAGGRDRLNREATQHTNSQLTAGNAINLTSGNDTTINGANAEAKHLNVSVGGDLTVASVQDTGSADGRREDYSGSITVGAGVSGGANVGQGETEGSTAWVSNQTSLIGSESVNIQVDGHTQVDGALIANIKDDGSDGGNLNLDTGTLGYTDFEDHDRENSDYASVGFGTGGNAGANAQTSAPESFEGDSATLDFTSRDKDRQQITRATIGEGNITVRDNPDQDLSDLNRDIDTAQEILKDQDETTDVYASTTSVESLKGLKETGEDNTLNQWGKNLTSTVSPDAWGQVGENATDALGDTGRTVSAVATEQNLGITDLWSTLDQTAKGTQLKNDLARNPDFAHIREGLASDDPEAYAQAVRDLGHLAQNKFGIDLTDIVHYDGDATDSTALAFNALQDTRGATVLEEGHAEYGNIFLNATAGDGKKEQVNTLGHEVLETFTLQTGAANDATQETQAQLFGEHLSSRVDGLYEDGLDATAGDTFYTDLGNSQTVFQGTQRADQVGSAWVDNRQLLAPEMLAIQDTAPQMAEALGISERDAEKRMAEELLSHVDQSWSERFDQSGRDSDTDALAYLGEALQGQGERYRPNNDSDVPYAVGEEPVFDDTPESIQQYLTDYSDNHNGLYQSRTHSGEGLTNDLSLQSRFYEQNLGTDNTLQDNLDYAKGEAAGVGEVAGNVLTGLAYAIENPMEAGEAISASTLKLVADPATTLGDIKDRREDAIINARLDALQGDHYSAGRTQTASDLELGLEIAGMVPVPAGKVAKVSAPHRLDGGMESLEKIEPPAGKSFSGEVYRFDYPERIETTWDAHPGNVNANHRYTEPGQPGVYGGTSERTAYQEVKHYGAEEGKVPTTSEISLNNVLDLTDSGVRESLGVKLEDLISDSYSVTHTLGKWAKEQGYDGILAPSARDKAGSNIVILNSD